MGRRENPFEGHIIVNTRVSGTGQVGAKVGGENGLDFCPDQPSSLIAELEALRRELVLANRSIANLVRERKRSRVRISRLKTMATIDVVTQLVNRRRFDQVLDAEFGLAVIVWSPRAFLL